MRQSLTESIVRELDDCFELQSGELAMLSSAFESSGGGGGGGGATSSLGSDFFMLSAPRSSDELRRATHSLRASAVADALGDGCSLQLRLGPAPPYALLFQFDLPSNYPIASPLNFSIIEAGGAIMEEVKLTFFF